METGEDNHETFPRPPGSPIEDNRDKENETVQLRKERRQRACSERHGPGPNLAYTSNFTTLRSQEDRKKGRPMS